MERESAQQRLQRILDHFARGGSIMLVSYERGRIYGPDHGASFRAGKSLYVKRGRAWDCLDFTPIKFSALSQHAFTRMSMGQEQHE